MSVAIGAFAGGARGSTLVLGDGYGLVVEEIPWLFGVRYFGFAAAPGANVSPHIGFGLTAAANCGPARPKPSR